MRFVVAFYRALLLCYPREFRARDGGVAAQLFADACRDDWRRGGATAVTRRLAMSVLEVPRAGLSERRDNRRRMRHTGGPSSWRGLGADFRQATRSIRRRPALMLTIIVTLAVGLGTNVAIFSVIDATWLRPLPYVHADRTVQLQAAPRKGGRATDPLLSWTRRWTTGARSLERVEARTSRSALITGGGPATRQRVMDVTGGYLDAIGARPILGRSLGHADDVLGAPFVVMLSQPFWRQHFSASPDIIGSSIAIDGAPHTIVGVADDFESDIAGLSFALAVPLHDDSTEPARTIVWLRPGVNAETAQAELSARPPLNESGQSPLPRLTRPQNIFWTYPQFHAMGLGLLAAALLILAIAGVNVSHLFLAVGQERASELMVRRALGATTGRVAQLLFVETLTLALTGSAAGLFVAWSLIRWLKSFDAGPQLQSRLDSIHVDPVIVAYAIGVGCFVALAFGLWPAIWSARSTSLAANGSGTRSSTRRRWSSSMLMTLETGLSAVLLIVAGIVGHAFIAMQYTPRGFDADRILSVRVSLPVGRYATPASRRDFFDRLATEAVKIPGVERFDLGYGAIPPTDFVAGSPLVIAGGPKPAWDFAVRLGFITPDYLSVMGIPLLQGRNFVPADLTAMRASDAPVPALISRSMARRLWPDGGAVGARFQTGARQNVRYYEVIGVAGDVSGTGLDAPMCEDCDVEFYLPLFPERMFTEVLLRLRPGVTPPTATLQAAIATIDPEVPSDDELGTADARLASFIGRPRLMASLFAAFAGVGIFLIAIGLSTVVSRAVAQRTREMGIRLALGATPGSVRSLIVKEGLRPSLVGLVIGLAAAVGVTRSIRAMLYGFSPADPLTLALAPLLLVTIVVAALIVPALRATRVDPATTLRAE